MITYHQNVQLGLFAPVEMCCNCGVVQKDDEEVFELIETEFKKTSYMFFYGSESTVSQLFAYCPQCKNSANRRPNGLFSKFLIICLIAVVNCLLLLMVGSSYGLPKVVSENFLFSAFILAFLFVFPYFFYQYWQAKNLKGRSYYQAVRVIDVSVTENTLHHLTLHFDNEKYARAFALANEELMQLKILKVLY